MWHSLHVPWEQVTVKCLLGSFPCAAGSCLVSGKGMMISAHVTRSRSSKVGAWRQMPSLMLASFFNFSTAGVFSLFYRCTCPLSFPSRPKLPVLHLDRAGFTNHFSTISRTISSLVFLSKFAQCTVKSRREESCEPRCVSHSVTKITYFLLTHSYNCWHGLKPEVAYPSQSTAALKMRWINLNLDP